MEPIETPSAGGHRDLGSVAAATSAAIASSYYDFGSYVSKTRMLTFWHQLDEVLATKPRTVLEIGVGPRVVAGALREFGVSLTTLDVNEALRPDLVGSVLALDQLAEENAFDTVLCARVLHHVPFTEFDRCLEQLARAARRKVVLTLPVDEARMYLAVRRTAGAYRVGSVVVPRAFKRVMQRFVTSGDARYRELWKIDAAAETSTENVAAALDRHFRIDKWYAMPEDRSHAVIVLTPK